MSVEEICALPIATLAAEDCRLWLWTTNRYLPASFGVMRAWGFEYRQTLVWHKLDANLGGSVAPNSVEFLLVGVRGRPRCKKRLKTALIATAHGKRHSQKPTEWYYLIETVSDGPYLELFARRTRPGWKVWGNEVESNVEIRPNAKLTHGGKGENI
jgi:N6-adenosine-specific RNA methylase IME4